MIRLAIQYAALGNRVEIYAVAGKGPLRNQLPSNIKVIALGQGRALFSVIKLKRILNDRNPMILLSAQAHINFLAILATRMVKRKPKLIVSERNLLSSVAKNSERLIDKYRALLARLLYPYADKVTTVSLAVAEDLSRETKISPNSIDVLYNPVIDETLFEKARAPNDHPWFAQDKYPVILGVGKLLPQKDFATLLRAFSLLNKERACRLIVVGEGPQKRELLAIAKKLNIEELVDFVGAQENPFVFMKLCDVFVLSSAWEGLPNVLIEAIACGAQFVSTDCQSGPREIINNDYLGSLVPVGDVELLAKEILSRIAEPLDNSKLIKSVIERFSVSSATDKYDRLFMVLLPR